MLRIEDFDDRQLQLYVQAKQLVDILEHRERQIVKLAVDGLDDKRIAVKLCISPNTVRNHITKIVEKAHIISGESMKFRNQIIPYVSCFYFIHSDSFNAY